MAKIDKDVEATPSEEADQEGSKRSLIRQPLHTLAGLITEACRVYRQMRAGKLDHQEGRSLVWCLGQMRAMVETQALERLEQRLEELAPSIEGRAPGHVAGSRPPQSTH